MSGALTPDDLLPPWTGNEGFEEIEEQLRLGNVYVTVHTSDGNPGSDGQPGDIVSGEIRGQIIPVGPIHVAAPGPLWNDVDDVDGQPADRTLADDPLTMLVVEGPEHGALTYEPDGSFSYYPDIGFSAEDSFTYVASDGFLGSGTQSAPATRVHITVRPGTRQHFDDVFSLPLTGFGGTSVNNRDPPPSTCRRLASFRMTFDLRRRRFKRSTLSTETSTWTWKLPAERVLCRRPLCRVRRVAVGPN